MTEALYMSKKTLAASLDCSESTVDDMVRRRVIPEGTRMSSGCMRWRWADVDAALRAINTRGAHQSLFAAEGVRNARTGGPL